MSGASHFVGPFRVALFQEASFWNTAPHEDKLAAVQKQSTSALVADLDQLQLLRDSGVLTGHAIRALPPHIQEFLHAFIERCSYAANEIVARSEQSTCN